jgi:hypothetical protein
MDPHQNLFFYYAGSSNVEGGRERQIEDNTTKALVNLLELSARFGKRSEIADPFLRWIGAGAKRGGFIRFALQRATIGEVALSRAKTKVLLGIAPLPLSAEVKLTPASGDSRPDAWIWGPDFAVCLETKVVGAFDVDQLNRHADTLGNLDPPLLKTWREVYEYFARALAALNRQPGSDTAKLLLTQFLEYLRTIAYRQGIMMEEFAGFRPDHFEACIVIQGEDAEDNRRSVQHYLRQFMDEVREQLPSSLSHFSYLKLGNVRVEYDHLWATLSRGKRPVQEAHYSLAIRGDEFVVRLLVESKSITEQAFKRLCARPEEFIKIASGLPEWDLHLMRRWADRPRLYLYEDVAKISLGWIGQADGDYLLKNIAELKALEDGIGLFALALKRPYPANSTTVQSKKFVATVINDMKQLIPIQRFLNPDPS